MERCSWLPYLAQLHESMFQMYRDKFDQALKDDLERLRTEFSIKIRQDHAHEEVKHSILEQVRWQILCMKVSKSFGLHCQ